MRLAASPGPGKTFVPPALAQAGLRAEVFEHGPSAMSRSTCSSDEAHLAQAPQRLLDVGTDIPGAVIMRVGREHVGRELDRAPAFGGEEELVPAGADVGADQLLAAP